MLNSFSGRSSSLSKKLGACVPNNLVKQVSDFRQLGVAVKGELNEVWVDRADLELNLISQMPAEQQA